LSERKVNIPDHHPDRSLDFGSKIEKSTLS
jgi:hypothetical protein